MISVKLKKRQVDYRKKNPYRMDNVPLVIDVKEIINLYIPNWCQPILVLTKYFSGDSFMETLKTLTKLMAWRPGRKRADQIEDVQEESVGLKILKQILAEHKANPRAAFVPLSERPKATITKLPSTETRHWWKVLCAWTGDYRQFGVSEFLQEARPRKVGPSNIAQRLEQSAFHIADETQAVTFPE